MQNKKTFLLLQGPPCSFISKLSASLTESGATCFRINFSLSDYLFNKKVNAFSFRDHIDNWEEYLRNFIIDKGVTDIIYHADRLPYHEIARSVANDLNINAISFENGYLRPHWLTLEHGGMSELSHFPDNPEQIILEGQKYQIPTPIDGLGHPFWVEASHEVVFNLINQFDLIFFPRYKADKKYNQLFEYLGYIPRLLKTKTKTHKEKVKQTFQKIRGLSSYFLFSLQMENDYQIRKNSKYSSQDDAIDEALTGLSQSGSDAFIVFKIHPHDNGIKKWDKIIPSIAKKHGLENKVIIIDGGDLSYLIKSSKGVITINSTVGVHAIQALRPVICLGIATYDIEGMTSSQSISDFIKEPEKPNRDLVDCFVKLTAHTIQIQGGYFLKIESEIAIKEMTSRLIEDRVNHPGAYVTPPPRLRKTQ